MQFSFYLFPPFPLTISLQTSPKWKTIWLLPECQFNHQLLVSGTHPLSWHYSGAYNHRKIQGLHPFSLLELRTMTKDCMTAALSSNSANTAFILFCYHSIRLFLLQLLSSDSANTPFIFYSKPWIVSSYHDNPPFIRFYYFILFAYIPFILFCLYSFHCIQIKVTLLSAFNVK